MPNSGRTCSGRTFSSACQIGCDGVQQLQPILRLVGKDQLHQLAEARSNSPPPQ